MLEISFSEKTLRNLCENSAKAEAALGIESAIRLQRRLADLRAVTSVKDLNSVCFYHIKGERGNELNFDLGGGFSMTVTPNHIKIPLLRSGRVDWKSVRRIKVVKIEREKK